MRRELLARALQGAGADWHDLVANLTPKRQPPLKNWRAMSRFCLEHERLLRSRELEFVAGLDRWHGDLTEKQFNWLSAIYERIQPKMNLDQKIRELKDAQEFREIQKFADTCRKIWPGAKIVIRPNVTATDDGRTTEGTANVID